MLETPKSKLETFLFTITFRLAYDRAWVQQDTACSNCILKCWKTVLPEIHGLVLLGQP